MHGQKKRRKRALGGDLDIDGAALRWVLVSEPQYTSDGYKGLCVSVRLAEREARELIVEYPYDRTVFLPQRPKLPEAVVEAAAREAMEAGWDPQSRGGAWLFDASTALEKG